MFIILSDTLCSQKNPILLFRNGMQNIFQSDVHHKKRFQKLIIKINSNKHHHKKEIFSLQWNSYLVLDSNINLPIVIEHFPALKTLFVESEDDDDENRGKDYFVPASYRQNLSLEELTVKTQTPLQFGSFYEAINA